MAQTKLKDLRNHLFLALEKLKDAKPEELGNEIARARAVREVAQTVVDCKPGMSKPLLTCWMGDSTVVEARVLLNDANIPTYRTPESAVGAFGYLSSFYQNQQLLQQTPPPLSARRRRVCPRCCSSPTRVVCCACVSDSTGVPD
mgnify:CR=1 FL=1